MQHNATAPLDADDPGFTLPEGFGDGGLNDILRQQAERERLADDYPRLMAERDAQVAEIAALREVIAAAMTVPEAIDPSGWDVDSGVRAYNAGRAAVMAALQPATGEVPA